MARHVGVTFHDVRDNSFTFLQLPIDCSIEELRSQWRLQQNSFDEELQFSISGGDELPMEGTIQNVLPENSFVLPIQIERKKEVVVTVLGAPHLNKKLKINSETTTNALLTDAKRRFGVDSDRDGRLLLKDSPLIADEPLSTQIDFDADDFSLILDLKVSVSVRDLSTVFPPLCEVDGGVSYSKEWTQPEGSSSDNLPLCFASENVRCLMRSSGPSSRQRLIEVDSLRVADEHSRVADLLGDGEVLQRGTITAFLERKITVNIDNKISGETKTLLLWPTTKIRNVLESPEENATCGGKILNKENSFLEERVVSNSLLTISKRVNLEIISSDGQCHTMDADHHTLLKDLREELRHWEHHTNFRVEHNGLELTSDSLQLSDLASGGTLTLKLFYKTRNVQITYGEEVRLLSNVSETTQYAELFEMVSKAFDETLHPDLHFKCHCGRIISDDNRQRQTLPMQCCDDETLDLTAFFSVDQEPSAPPPNIEGWSGEKLNIFSSQSEKETSANPPANGGFILEIMKQLIAAKGDIDHKNDSGESVLHLATRKGDANVICLLLDSGADINCRANEGMAPIHIAAQDNNPELVALFLDRHDDIHKETTDGLTALHIAAQKGHLDTVRLLIDRHADVNRRTKKGSSPLHIACLGGYTDVAQLLIYANSDMNAKNNAGLTCLHIAAHAGQVEITKMLISMGCDKAIRSAKGSSALHLAVSSVSKSQLMVMWILIEAGLDVNCSNVEGLTPLHLASTAGHFEVVKFLVDAHCNLNITSKLGSTALHLATMKHHVEVAKLLIASKCDINIQTMALITPLHLAAQENQVEITRLLIDSCCDLERLRKDGYTPLHVAVQSGHFVIAQLLIQAGSDMKKLTSAGLNPLHIAIVKGQVDCVQLLLNCGCDMTQRTTKGSSPIQLAIFHKNLDTVRHLINHRCDVNVQAPASNFTPLHMAAEAGLGDIVLLLLNANANVNSRSKMGKTPLYMAAKKGHLRVVQHLVAAHCDIDCKADDDSTALHVAATEGHVDVVRFLIAQRSNCLSITRNGKTALHLAAEFGRLEVVRHFLEVNVPPGNKTNDGRTPETLAAANGHHEVVRILREAANRSGPFSSLFRSKR